MADSQDDDFDDLFSFGADTTTATTATTTPASASSSDFDLLADLNTAPAPAPVAATDDDFDDLFGTPPGTPITPKTPLDATANELPSPELNNVKQSIDDFHVHDAGTRDFLEWLDDDDNHKDSLKSSGCGEEEAEQDDGFGDDDFDFDQMLAEADVSSSLKSSQQTGALLKSSGQSDGGSEAGASVPQVGQVQQSQSSSNEQKETHSGTSVHKPAAPESKDNTVPPPTAATEEWSEPITDPIAPVESRNSQLSTGTITPEPISKPYVSACIEEELAFDSWNDDDADDFQIAAADEGDDSNPVVDAEDGAAATDASKLGPVSSPPKATFTTLSEAIRSNAATIDDVRTLFNREKGRSSVSLEDRPYLWTKVICGKVLGELDNGSLAESFREWQKKCETNEKYSSETSGAMIEHMLLEAGSNSSGNDEDLLSVLGFHEKDASSANIDPLLPPVAYAILQSGIPPAAASVVMSQIEPSAMSLLRLTQIERYSAVKNLHMDFYLLACYHLPLLVMHLDRQCPGWYWPKPLVAEKTELEQPSAAAESESADTPKVEAASHSKNQHAPESGGVVPLSWFITNFAGELGKSCLNHKILLPLWDYLLTLGDCSRKFFLAIAMLDKHSDSLLMSRGDDLKVELEKVLNFKAHSFDEESFVGTEGNGEVSKSDGASTEMVTEWISMAQSLSESTPSSVINMLRSVDDRAVTDALTERKAALDAKEKAQIEAEEAAKKKEREERDAEAKKALMKARLVSYYREVCPEKVDTIDQIYNMFDGRFEVLNDKLKKKYGRGFLLDEPVKDQVSNQTRNFFESVNKSISETRKHVVLSVAERRKKNAKPTPTVNQAKSKVALEISPTEIIPHVCSAKGHNPVTGEKWSSIPESNLKFYLIDCRPESIAKEQGRFPTAVNMGPQKLQDPDELQQLTEMFESLRGAVHICVMGEGFSSFPALYDHPLTYEEEKLLEDDISRTSNCCLFFLKKGFPFVSILKGGFAAAHAFLWRSGPEMGLPPSNVLVDYDPMASLFAQLETDRQEQEEFTNAPAREKTARTLQKIIDRSMTRLTLEEQRLNSLASDFSRPENVDKMKQSVKTFSQKVSTTSISFGKTPPLFMSKKFPSSKPPTDAGAEQEATSKMPSIASFKEKMSLKLSTTKETTEISSSGKGENRVSESNAPKDDNVGQSTSGDGIVSDSLSTVDIDSSAKLDQEPTEATAVDKQFPSMSQFRLKMGFSNKIVQDNSTDSKPNDIQGDSEEKGQLKNPFGFLKKQDALTNQTMNETTCEQNGAPSSTDTTADGTNQVKNPFGFLKKQAAPTSQSIDDLSAEGSAGASQSRNTFGFLKKQAAPVSEDGAVKTASDSAAAEAMKTKFASLSKFGSSLLHKKEAQEDGATPTQNESDVSDKPKQSPPSSPVKATFTNFSKSFEAVKSGANKLLNEISEHEDPFNPKNSRPTKTRFSGAQQPVAKKPSASLFFMEDEPDDGLEDVIDFGATESSETTEELSDPFEALAQASPAKSDDLFSGLNPEPTSDLTEDIFGSVFDENTGAEKAEEKAVETTES